MELLPLYLIDAYALIYRWYFAFLKNPLRNSSGKNVSALYGFSKTIISLLNDGAPIAKDSGSQKKTPAFLAAVFDSSKPTFRHKMYDKYKATRQKAPEDLHEQVPLVMEFLDALKIPRFSIDGFEADDIIASLSCKCKAENRECYIISSDKDLLQLVGSGVFQLRPAKADAAGAGLSFEIIGEEEVKQLWSVPPNKILDLLSLTGDTSDNIPGVKGIGEKTAVKLMARYGSLDEIYKNIACVTGSPGKLLAEGKESAYLSRDLIRLETDIDLSIKNIEESLCIKDSVSHKEAAAKMLMREGLRHNAKLLDKNVTNTDTNNVSKNDNNNNNSNAALNLDAVNKEFAESDKQLFGNGCYTIVNDIKTLTTIIEKAKEQKLIALDFETDSLDAWNARPIGISLALKPKEAFYVPLAPHGVGEDGIALDPVFIELAEVKPLLQTIFDDDQMTVAAHNAKYDYKVSRGFGGRRWKCRIWDTMVASWLTDLERNNYSLDSIASYIFDYTAVKYKDIVAKDRTFDSVPLQIAANYSCSDADYCLRFKYYYEKRLEKFQLLKLFYEMEMPLLPVLAEMEGLGIKIEKEILTNYGAELAVSLDTLQDQTWKMAGEEFNLSSPKQLQEILFVKRKLTPGKKIKTGFSTDAATLEELAREDELPALILRHRTLSKLKSTYVDTLAAMTDNNARLHTSYDPCGTATGRLSSREPNLQNIPVRAEEGRRIREAFTAEKGNVLISADYSQIELVILAHLSKDENLLAAFNEGTDVHVRTASLIFAKSENEITSEERRVSKTINFGVMYGMSAFRLAGELGISRTEASRFIKAYFNTYAGVRAFIENLIKTTEETGFVQTICGRRRYINAINSRNKTEKAAAERVAVNTPIQGSAADIVKIAMLNLDKRLNLEKSGASLLLQVHDELIFECPKGEAEKAKALISYEMESAVKLTVPLRAHIEIGERWGSFH